MSKTIPKSQTTDALAAAQAERDRAARALEKANQAFEETPSQETLKLAQLARAQLEESEQILSALQKKKEVAEQAERDRLAAEVEAKRIADLAANSKERAENELAAMELIQKFAAAYARDWALLIRSQSLGSQVPSTFKGAVSMALMDALIANELPPTMLRLT